MMINTLLGVWLMQAPGFPDPSMSFTPTVKEWKLGRRFVIKQEKFLLWQTDYHPSRGWFVTPRPTWMVEIAPTNPRLKGLAFAIESVPAMSPGSTWMVRVRLQYQIPSTQIRIGLEGEWSPAVGRPGERGGGMLQRGGFLSGRF